MNLRLVTLTTTLLAIISLTVAGSALAREQENTSQQYVQAKRAICYYFGSYCSQAISVSYCETGGTMSVWAGYRKHQYWGLFQMGSNERKTYGHGWNVWAQAKAAYRYFVASGRDWSPWDCKP